MPLAATRLVGKVHATLLTTVCTLELLATCIDACTVFIACESQGSILLEVVHLQKPHHSQ